MKTPLTYYGGKQRMSRVGPGQNGGQAPETLWPNFEPVDEAGE